MKLTAISESIEIDLIFFLSFGLYNLFLSNFMAERTIKISHLPEGTTEATIRNALGDAKVSRLYLHQHEAFVELENSEALEVLEFST